MGIGAATARAFALRAPARHPVRLALLARSPAPLSVLAQGLCSFSGVQALSVVADVTQPQHIRVLAGLEWFNLNSGARQFRNRLRLRPSHHLPQRHADGASERHDRASYRFDVLIQRTG